MSDLTCPTCSEVLPLSAFSIRGDTGRPASECKRCRVKRARRWRQANPERYRALVRESQARRRADPDIRQRENDRANERSRRKRRSEGRTGPIDATCERCGRDFTYVKVGAGRRRSVCEPCRELDWAWSLYGLNSVSLPEFYERHGNRCGICEVTGSPTQWGDRLMIDHDHESGALRGLLCSPCNTAIGLFGDDPARLRLAAEYLERF